MYAVHGGTRLCYHGARDKGHKVVSLCKVYIVGLEYGIIIHVYMYVHCMHMCTCR